MADCCKNQSTCDCYKAQQSKTSDVEESAYLSYPIVRSRLEHAPPVEVPLRVRARVEEVHGEEVRLACIRAEGLENVVSYPMHILRPTLDHAIWQCLHHLHLLFFIRSVLLVVVTVHRSPWYVPVRHSPRKLGQHALRIPGRALPVQLVAGEDDEVRPLLI